jgi:hypothetical protein
MAALSIRDLYVCAPAFKKETKMDRSNSNWYDATSLLARHRGAQVLEAIKHLTQQLLECAKALADVAVGYQDLAWIHHVRLPSPAETRPRADFDQERRAKLHRIGGLAAQGIGVAIFAMLGQASLNVDAPAALIFAGCAILGVLFCVVVSAVLAMITKAGPRNPAAERPLRRLAVISGVAAGVSALLLMCCRFVDGGPLIVLIPPLIVVFEVSIVLMGASLEAMHAIYTWSSVLEQQYNAFCAEHARLELELSAATAELEQLKPIIVKESEEQEKSHENLHVRPLVNGSAANSMHTERRTGTTNN